MLEQELVKIEQTRNKSQDLLAKTQQENHALNDRLITMEEKVDKFEMKGTVTKTKVLNLQNEIVDLKQVNKDFLLEKEKLLKMSVQLKLDIKVRKCF